MGIFSFLKNAGAKLFKSDEVKKAEAQADEKKSGNPRSLFWKPR